MTRHIYSRLKVARQKFANADLFLKVSVVSLLACFKTTNCSVFGSDELLSNAGGLWSVILPLSAHKLMNEIVEESQRSANPIWQ